VGLEFRGSGEREKAALAGREAEIEEPEQWKKLEGLQRSAERWFSKVGFPQKIFSFRIERDGERGEGKRVVQCRDQTLS
jgi:hypothetical protein